MKAVVLLPIADMYCVEFYYTEDGHDWMDHTKPRVVIPCRDYDHAKAVAAAYNQGAQT